MTSSMYSAIAGLRTHMSALSVIGNNISNINTLGYKATRYTFNEALYTLSRSGSNGSETEGGRNPAQVGFGCSVGTIDLDMSTKNYTPTGVGLDCMIDGDGFFITGDKNQTIRTQDELQASKLTRLGNLEFRHGYLVDGNGNVIFGYACLGREDPEDDQSPYIYSSTLTPVRYPKMRVVRGQEEEPDTYQLLYPTAENGYLTYEGDATGEDDDTEELPMPVLNNVSIDEKTGRVIGITDEGDQQVCIGIVAIGKVDNPNGVTHVEGRIYQALGGAGMLHATVMGGVPDGLQQQQQQQDNFFEVSSAGETKLVGGGLESSGTDMAQEISNMIVIQRGYQANTRVVTVTDSMLEELINMKR